MAIISPQDRARLILVLEKRIPDIQDQTLQELFSLMLTLLHDYNELEAHALEQGHIALNETARLRELYSQLLQQAELGSGCRGYPKILH